jgi:hypothetical protein
VISALPTLTAIQRTNAVLAVALSLILLLLVSPRVALGCVLGTAVMIANLSLLAVVGRWILAAAGQNKGSRRLGIIAAPLKLLFIITVVALLLSRAKISVAGFLFGALTQPAAILLEIFRMSAIAASRRREDAGAHV